MGNKSSIATKSGTQSLFDFDAESSTAEQLREPIVTGSVKDNRNGRKLVTLVGYFDVAAIRAIDRADTDLVYKTPALFVLFLEL